MYDSLTVAVVVNPQKAGFFTVDERAEMLREVTKNIPNVRIDKFRGLLADYVNENGFTAVVRGLRDTADFLNEFQMAQMQAADFLVSYGMQAKGHWQVRVFFCCI
jgi:pantetheine-phosphate adenylyltransferase